MSESRTDINIVSFSQKKAQICGVDIWMHLSFMPLLLANMVGLTLVVANNYSNTIWQKMIDLFLLLYRSAI